MLFAHDYLCKVWNHDNDSNKPNIQDKSFSYGRTDRLIDPKYGKDSILKGIQMTSK